MRSLFAICTIAVCGLSTAFGVRAAAQPVGAAIQIVDFDYHERAITVPSGSTVTWNNSGGRPHTATDRGGTFNTGHILAGKSASVTLDVPGTYFYFCEINPKKMNGTIVVESAPTGPNAVRVQTVDAGNIPTETLRFDPPTLTVDVGATIVVANVGGQQHSFTLDDGSLTTPVLPPGPEGGRFAGTNISLTATKPGTFAFHCEVHPDTMRGLLTVRPVAGTEPVVESTTPPPTTLAEPAEPTTSVEPTTSPPPTTAVEPTSSAEPTTSAEPPPTTVAAPATSPPTEPATTAPSSAGGTKSRSDVSLGGVIAGLATVVVVLLGVALLMRRRDHR